MTFFSPADILAHLQEYIPRLTNRFSDNAVVSGEIIDGDPQTLQITDAAHGLSAGDQVVLIGTKIDNAITDITVTPDPISGINVLRFTTAKEHDLTQDYTVTVELSGFTDAGLNGEFPLISVPSRTLFEIESAISPTLNGSEVLRESWEVGLDGIFTVDSVVDANTYDISLEGKPDFTPGVLPSIYRASNFRMGVTVDIERAQAIYTKQADKDHLYLFVIMGDSAASKDRNIESDANQANAAQNAARILMVNTFSLVVFFPTETELTGADASQLAWNDILKIMLSVAAGIRFDDFGNTRYRSSLLNHGTGRYANAFYSHVYEFEYNYEITAEEEFLTQFITSRAFRDNSISLGGISGDLDLDGDEELT